MSIQEVLNGRRSWWIELGDAGAVLEMLPAGCAKLVMIDSPWSYAAGRKGHGRASEHYATLPMSTIAQHVASSFRVASDPAYLFTWVTFANIFDWIEKHHASVRAGGWKPSTGGAWGKITGQGIGYYAWGDAEAWLLYTKGQAVPPASSQKPSNLLLDSLLITPRIAGHSVKPSHLIDKAIECYTRPDDLVLDFYAGSSGFLGKICTGLCRRYIGVEIDPKRRDASLAHLAQYELDLTG